MPIARLFAPLRFPHGRIMKNRFMLAPLTNSQSHADGTLSEAEFHWLVMRAKGGFGMTMTCAAHVQAVGQAFPGQLGIFDDRHSPGLKRLADAIRAEDSLSVVQLHHGGNRANPVLMNAPAVCLSNDPETGARALSTTEVEGLVEDFARAAKRAELAGFDGVELHGAHGYILCQFFSAALNRRTDRYGGTLENRSRVFFEIIDRIRARCRSDFIVGVRLSPERYGVALREMHLLAQRLIDTGQIDFLDFSLWSCFKEPDDEEFRGRPLIDHFMDLDRKGVRFTVAGKIMDPATALQCLDAGADFVALGRAAILHHDYPKLLAANPGFLPASPPVSDAWLAKEGLSAPFIGHMRTTWFSQIKPDPKYE